MIAGDFRPDDLTHLFLFARDRCDGRESVREIGDFIAHHAEREKGILTRTTRDWFAIALFSAWRLAPGRGPVDPQNLPVVFPDHLWATYRRANTKSLRAACGLSQTKAAKLLQSAITKFTKSGAETYALTGIPFKELAPRIESIIDGTTVPPVRSSAPTEQQNRAALNDLWRRGLGIRPDDPVDRWLESRGVGVQN
jgi:hypothetical protein